MMQQTQWHKLNPQRYKEEVKRIKNELPKFKHYFDDENNAVWEGKVLVNSVSSTLNYDPKYKELDVKIITKSNYPLSFPLVVDTTGTLTECPHMYKKVNAICYSFGANTEIDFEKDSRIADLYSVTQQFLVKQSIYEETKTWPDGQHHGESAFILSEFNNGCFDVKSLCACRLEGKTYGECHLPQVDKMIGEINNILKREYGEIKFGRNSKCLCGSNKKYKRCCIYKRKNFIQLYPQLEREFLTKILDTFDKLFEQKKAEK